MSMMAKLLVKEQMSMSSFGNQNSALYGLTYEHGEPERKNLLKQSAKKGAAKASDNSRKRKSKDSSESEDEENGDDESDASEDQVNGQTEKKSKRGSFRQGSK
ncbi:hypothetical protein POTOM_009381 [Populus tomentosa]|uniref:Uncharacterized protein n=1 Tax=Populus tomentosa TaxID=118781 RepID=A0A8X8D9J5_POPTO|nr:hypothetical protein POTOM_009381 [Populus tomentosa]